MTREPTPAEPPPATGTVNGAPLDLEALSRETGAPIEVLRTLAAISDPANAHLFSAAAAAKAFAGVKVRDVKVD